MKSLKYLCSTLLTATCLNVFASAAMAQIPVVPCWQPHDFSFTSSAKPANPFMVSFSAKVTGPNGKTFALPGFYDGEGVWKIRVSPTTTGDWSLVTQSDVAELSGRKVDFTGVKNTNPNSHGLLRVDSEHPHHFIFDDGTRFFMQAHIFIKVYNKAVKWPEKGSPEEALFFRWIMARYAAYPNIIWDFSKEAHNEKNLTYKQGWLKTIRATDPYHHLVTVHDDDAANDSGAYDDLTDFRADQHHQGQKGRNDHDTILFQRERRAWPVANVESDYECGLKGLEDKTYGKVMTPEATASTLWDIAMAGGYTGYYYTFTAWDVIRPFDEPKGYTYMKHFGDFWRSTEYWKLDPSDQLVNSGWCLAQPGREYVVFQRQDLPFTLNIDGVTSTLTGEWFNPLTGKRSAAGKFKNGTAMLTPPADWGDTPLVLHIKEK